MENNIKSKSLVEAALMAGITFILMMLTTLPIFDLIGVFLIPIPITLLYLRHSKKAAWLSAVVNGILVSLFYSPFVGIQSVVVYGLIGVILGYCIKSKKSAVNTFFYVIVANAIGMILQLTLGLVVFSKINIHDFLQQIVDTFQEGVNMAASMGINNPNVEQVLEIYKSIDVNFLMMILPFILILQVIVGAFFNITITKSILRKLGYKMESLPPFSKWYLDSKVGAGLIIFCCISTVLKVKKVPFGDTAFFTAYYMLLFVFVIQGLSVISYFLKNKLKLTNGFIVLIEIMIMLSALGIFIFVLGLTDLIMDIRGVDPNSLGTYIRSKIKANV